VLRIESAYGAVVPPSEAATATTDSDAPSAVSGSSDHPVETADKATDVPTADVQADAAAEKSAGYDETDAAATRTDGLEAATNPGTASERSMVNESGARSDAPMEAATAKPAGSGELNAPEQSPVRESVDPLVADARSPGAAVGSKVEADARLASDPSGSSRASTDAITLAPETAPKSPDASQPSVPQDSGGQGPTADTASVHSAPDQMRVPSDHVMGTESAVASTDKTAAVSEAPEADAEAVGEVDSQRLEELAHDPSEGGGVTDKSKEEARVAYAMEKSGDLPGPVRRDPSGRADFIDGTGREWDVKSFRSNDPPRKGSYDFDASMSNIGDELAIGEDVIVNTTHMSPQAIQELKEGVGRAGWADRVLWWPGAQE
jgi:hypothetical protein